VSVNEAFHEHAYAGTSNSECRRPADDFYPVETRIEIDFPVIPCTKENFKECILLDPITALSNFVALVALAALVAPRRRPQREAASHGFCEASHKPTTSIVNT
jgi:hypothetical protein